MTDEVVTPLIDDNGVDINVTVVPPNESDSTDEHELSDDISAFQAVAAQILTDLRAEIAAQIGPLREEMGVVTAFMQGMESEIENVSESVETIETTIQEATSESNEQVSNELSGEPVELPESITTTSESESETDSIEPKSSHWYWRHIGK